MPDYKLFTLENGLTVAVIEDSSTPLVTVNIAYNIGSKDENPNKTGFAHLFEHLMFGGSLNIPNYDTPLQMAGGENNAFTCQDYTNYYLTIPSQNIETAFWLESDRMKSLAFSEKSLEVQRKVVIEEFKQSYLNQPYGDAWLLLSPLAYKTHPYSWNTIGKEISHIENATMDDVKAFFYSYYLPNNAIMVVAGNTSLGEVKRLSEKWFGDIPKGNVPVRNLPQEPLQKEARQLFVERDVPNNAIYKAYKMCDRLHSDYYACDLLSDILSRGDSARLSQRLVLEKKLFLDISAYVAGTIDGGLFIISGKLNTGVSYEEAEAAIELELADIKNNIIADSELQKVKNKAETTFVFGQMGCLNRAMNLAYSHILGDISFFDTEQERIQAVTPELINTVAKNVFNETHCSTLYYKIKPQIIEK